MGVIYSIRNEINGACYIGSTASKDGKNRWQRHVSDLNKNIHHSKYLQRAWNKYGSKFFKFIVLEYVIDDVLNVEQQYLDDRKNNYPRNLNYNVCWTAGNCTGRKHTDKTKKKISDSKKGVRYSDDEKKKYIDAWENKFINSNVYYTLISPDNIEYKFSSIRKFCREHGLKASAIRLLILDKIYYCNGWVKNYNNTYSFISPDGVIYNNIVNLKEFCDANNLKLKGMSAVHREYRKSYYGWVKFKKN